MYCKKYIYLTHYFLEPLFKQTRTTNMKNNKVRKLAEKLIEDCRLQIAEKLSGKIADSQKADSQIRRCADSPNTLTTFPQYLKKPIRFWSTNVGDEIRSTFDLELYVKVCESRGLESGVETVGGKLIK